jgi:hypothetical protein
MTVVETPWFLRDAASALTERERFNLVAFLAANPEAGDIMAETGGIRKLRWDAGPWKAWQSQSDLLLPLRISSPVPAERVLEE